MSLHVISKQFGFRDSVSALAEAYGLRSMNYDSVRAFHEQAQLCATEELIIDGALPTHDLRALQSTVTADGFPRARIAWINPNENERFDFPFRKNWVALSHPEDFDALVQFVVAPAFEQPQ